MGQPSRSSTCSLVVFAMIPVLQLGQSVADDRLLKVPRPRSRARVSDWMLLGAIPAELALKPVAPGL